MHFQQLFVTTFSDLLQRTEPNLRHADMVKDTFYLKNASLSFSSCS